MALMTAYWGLDGLILFTGLFLVAYVYMTRKFNYWKKRGVVEVAPTPFVGNFLDCFCMRKSPGELLRDLYEKHDGLPYVGFYILDKPFLMVRDPDLVKNILVKDFNYFADRHASTDVDDRLGYANLFMIKNPAWKVLRSKLTPIFTTGKLKKWFEHMSVVGEDLDVYLNSLALDGDGQDIEMKELCAKFTTDMIGTMAYGLQVNSLNNPDAEFRKYGRRIFEANLKRAMDFTVLFFTPFVAKLTGSRMFVKETENFLRDAFWATINHRIESGNKRNDLIDLLIELRESHKDNPDIGGFKFDGDDLVAQAAIFFTGGFETSSTTISFALYELAVNPDVQNRLRQEILAGLESTNGKVTYDMINSLSYLDMVVAETLRKYPALPFLDRVVLADYKIPGTDLVLAKGTPVFISMTGLHYDPEYFPDPMKFDPERFTDENKKQRRPFTYMPFGEGPHNCIGMRLGLLQTKMGLIHMLKEHEIRPCKDTPIPMRFDTKSLVTAAEGGMNLNIRKFVASVH